MSLPLLALALALPFTYAASGGLCGDLHPQCQPYARLLATLPKKKEEWLRVGGITEQIATRTKHELYISEGVFVTIADGVAYVNMSREGFETRLYSSLLLLNRAMARLGRHNFPDVEFGIHPGDNPHGVGAAFNFCSPKGGMPLWLWPDYMFYAWPEIAASTWAQQLSRTAELDRTLPFKDRINKLFWRGGGGPLVREKLLSRFSNRTDIADIAKIPPFDGLRNELMRDPDFNISSSITRLEDFCRYKYIVHTEGNTWSVRLKSHLICGGVVFAHPLKWDAVDTEILEEGRNVITVDEDWNGLEEAYRALEADPARAQSIAEENAKLRSLFDEDGISCYILEALKCYKDVMQYTPTPPTRSWRYTTLENFVLAKMKPAPWMAYGITAHHTRRHHRRLGAM